MKKSRPNAGGALHKDGETPGRSAQSRPETGTYQAETLKWQEAQLSKLKVTNASLQEAVAWRERQVKALDKAQAYLEEEIERLHRTITSNDEALAWRAEQVEELEKASASKDEALEWRRKQAEQLQGDLAYLQAKHDTVSDQLRDMRSELNLIRESTGWKMLEQFRRFRDRALPEGTSGRAIYEKVIGLLRSRLGA